MEVLFYGTLVSKTIKLDLGKKTEVKNGESKTYFYKEPQLIEEEETKKVQIFHLSDSSAEEWSRFAAFFPAIKLEDDKEYSIQKIAYNATHNIWEVDTDFVQIDNKYNDQKRKEIVEEYEKAKADYKKATMTSSSKDNDTKYMHREITDEELYNILMSLYHPR